MAQAVMEVERIRQYPGQIQVVRKVKVQVPGKHFPQLTAAEQKQFFEGSAVEYVAGSTTTGSTSSCARLLKRCAHATAPSMARAMVCGRSVPHPQPLNPHPRLRMMPEACDMSGRRGVGVGGGWIGMGWVRAAHRTGVVAPFRGDGTACLRM